MDRRRSANAGGTGTEAAGGRASALCLETAWSIFDSQSGEPKVSVASTFHVVMMNS